MTAIEAVTFDVGGTLLRPYPSVGHVYATVVARHGYPNLNPEALTRRFLQAWTGKEDFDYSRAAWERLVHETFHDIIPVRHVPFEALYQRFAQPDTWELCEHVLPTLLELRKRGLRLAIISNWDERLRPLLEAISLPTAVEKSAPTTLAELFDGRLIVSHELGCTKPSPAIFHHACQLLGVAPEAVLHVGDSVREDLMGARGAGMQGLLLDPAGATPYSIADLREVPRLLENNSGSQP